MTLSLRCSTKSPEANRLKKVQLILTMSTTLRPRNKDSPKRNCRPVGSIPSLLILMMPASPRLVNELESTPGTSLEQELLSICPKMPPLEFPTLNGIGSSEERFLTSTTSSPLSTALQLMKRERLTSAMQKSALEWLMQNGTLPQQLIGLLPGNSHLKLLNLPSPIALGNSLATASSFLENLQPSLLVCTPESYSMTSPSIMLSKGDNVPCSRISNSTCASTLPSSCPMLSSPVALVVLVANRPNHGQAVPRSTSVTNLTELVVAPPQTMIAATATSARNAKRQAMEGNNVPLASKPYHDILGVRPHYLHYNLWDSTTPFHPTVADWLAETAIPLPPPPLSELNDLIVRKTISDNPHLFRIITPINVDHFETLLSDHPNLLFVELIRKQPPCSGCLWML